MCRVFFLLLDSYYFYHFTFIASSTNPTVKSLKCYARVLLDMITQSETICNLPNLKKIIR